MTEIISAVTVAMMGLFVSSLQKMPLKKHLVRPLQALSFFVVLAGVMAILSIYRWVREFLALPLVPEWYLWQGEWLFGLIVVDVFLYWVWACMGIALLHEPDGMPQSALTDRRFRYNLAFLVFTVTVVAGYAALWWWLA